MSSQRMTRWLLAGLAVSLIVGLVWAGDEPKKAAEKPAGPIVVLETNVGTIELALWPDVAPATVENFLLYVRDGFYDGTIFHRVAKNPPVIQGGGFARDLSKKSTRPPIKLEAVESNRKYTIAMARSQRPDSATAQFYINTQNNTFLDARQPGTGYAVFGKVIKGAGVVDQIARSETRNKGGAFGTIPVREVFIKTATVRPAPKASGK